jgi:phage gpG-like protein
MVPWEEDAMKVEVTGGDKYEAVLEKIAKLKITVRAGIPAGATATDGKSIPEYALYNELGTTRIPARPFMRTTADTHSDEWCQTVEGALNYKEIDQNQGKLVMGLVGEQMKAHIQETIQKGGNPPFAPNAKRTVDAKTAKGKVEPDHPLIDTGQMLASIISEVKEL